MARNYIEGTSTNDPGAHETYRNVSVIPVDTVNALATTGFGTGNLLSGIEYDNGVATYPDAVTEVYTFKLASTTVAVITLVYTDSTKDSLSTWDVVK